MRIEEVLDVDHGDEEYDYPMHDRNKIDNRHSPILSYSGTIYRSCWRPFFSRHRILTALLAFCCCNGGITTILNFPTQHKFSKVSLSYCDTPLNHEATTTAKQTEGRLDRNRSRHEQLHCRRVGLGQITVQSATVGL